MVSRRMLWCGCLMATVLASAAGRSDAVEIIGHRGASHDAPENTVSSVKLSWKQNADATEIDIHLSKDGEVVVIHDDNTKKTGQVDKLVKDQTLAELRRIDVGSWKAPEYKGEKIPTLAEVLATIPEGKRLFIEVKCGPEVVEPLKRALAKAGKRPEQTPVISFSHEVVTAVKKAMPELQVYFLVNIKQDKETKEWSPTVAESIRRAQEAGVDGLDFSAVSIIDKAYVDTVKQANLGFYVWTVNAMEDALRLEAAGVDGITTDRPGWMREQFQQSGK